MADQKKVILNAQKHSNISRDKRSLIHIRHKELLLLESNCSKEIHRDFEKKLDIVEDKPLDELQQSLNEENSHKISPYRALKIIDHLDISKNKYDKLLQFMNEENLKGLFPSKRQISKTEKEILNPIYCDSNSDKVEINIKEALLRTLREILFFTGKTIVENNDNIKFFIKIGIFNLLGKKFYLNNESIVNLFLNF